MSGAVWNPLPYGKHLTGCFFPFPQPHEQGSKDWFNSNNCIIFSSKGLSNKRKSLRQGNTDNITRLVRAILRGESKHKLIKKIEEANGLETLLHLTLRIQDSASTESVSRSRKQLTLTFFP